MNGIPVKLIKNTEAGPDVETAYFSTMRKEPKLRELLRSMMKAEVDLNSASKRHLMASKAMETADSNETIDNAASALEASIMALDDASQALADSRYGFIKAGFAGAGYDDLSADRLACEYPVDKLAELISASRVGAGLLDFSKPSGTPA